MTIMASASDQLKKYFWLSEIVFSGGTVACTPSTVTAKVSGIDLDVRRPGIAHHVALADLAGVAHRHHLPLQSETLARCPASCAACETKVTQVAGKRRP